MNGSADTKVATAAIAGDASADGDVSSRPQWSVVVITRNEEANVENCLRSVVEGFRGRSLQIVLVDSASIDRTVEIARRFPATIVCLPADSRLNPAVGRYFGFLHARGEYVLFLDGDCIVDAEWVAPAEAALRADPTLGGVAGASYGLLGEDADGHPVFQDEYPHADYDTPTYLAGSAAYKREVLDKVGGFNPNLFACEEEEFGARVRKGGYTMRRLRQTMSQHHPRNAKESVAELFRRLRRRYFVGLGQLVRHTFAHRLPVERPLASINRHVIFFALLVAGTAAALASAVSLSAIPLLAWLTLMIAGFTLFAVRAGELRKPAYYFLEWAVASPVVLFGVLLPPRSAASLHAGFEPARVIEPDTSTDN